MKSVKFFLILLSFIPMLGATDAEISGDYVEVRTADIYTGPCFANAEVGLTGREAILAWRVQKGSWQGVPIKGLSVVAVIHANATLGDIFSGEVDPARSILIVDEVATQPQRQALMSFAKFMAPDLLNKVIDIEIAPIDFQVGEHQNTILRAGGVASIATRSLGHGDHLCGNEFVYYPPLSSAVDAKPAFTLENEFRGEAFGTRWSSPSKKSAFVGKFVR
jgi:hypothetical protein